MITGKKYEQNNMEKLNKNAGVDNSDKKLHISDAIDSENIRKYIKSLKNKIFQIQNNIPEFWMHEDLKEIQVLYRIINELKILINDTSNDVEMDNIKNWLEEYSRSV